MAWLLLSVLAVAAAAEPTPSALLEAGHFKQLRALAAARLRANPDDAPALHLMGRVKLAYGDLEGALPLAERAVALDGRNADHRYLLAMVSAQKAQRAGLFGKLGLARRFKREAEAALALDPRHVDALVALVEFHLQAPGIAGGDTAVARMLAERITAIDPARGYLAQARIALAQKQTTLLEGLYLRALTADPRRYGVQLALAGFYAAPEGRKDYKRAEAHAREALKLDPGRGSAYAALAGLLAQQVRFDELDALLALAEDRVPENAAPYYQAGRALLTLGQDFPRAERYFRKYLTREPEGNSPSHAHALWRLGQVLEKQGRKSEAVTSLEAALRMRPDLEEASKDLGRMR